MDRVGRAYGAGLAGGPFDVVKFIRKPRHIVRIVSWLFSIIVFACIGSGGWYYDTDKEQKCVFGNDANACGFGVAVGVLAFLVCTAFILIDLRFSLISSIQLRKQVVIGDFATSAAGAFFFFVSFCYLTNKWTKRTEKPYDRNNPQAAIAFSFFSIFSWGVLTYYGWRRYQEGAANAFASDEPYVPDDAVGGPGYGYPAGTDAAQSYQEAPFSTSNEGAQHYQQPAY